MRHCPVRLALLPIRNAVAQRASPSSMIRRRPDPVPPDQINTSPDLILPVSLQLLGGKSAKDGISASPVLLNLTTHLLRVSKKHHPPSSYNCHCTVITIYIKYSLSFLCHLSLSSFFNKIKIAGPRTPHE